jgi:phosphoglycerate dehydrogenase-like enzyme
VQFDGADVRRAIAHIRRQLEREDWPLRFCREALEMAAVVQDYDYLVLAAPLTADTRGLVNAGVLAAMKPSARLINLGRGELVYTGALTEALASGSIAGAALDVVHPEPLPEGHALWNMENVIITPHMSGDTEDFL